MIRKVLLAGTFALLSLSGGSAFADGEGTFVPTVVASPASGASPDRGTGRSFTYNQAEGGQPEMMAASPARGPARGVALSAGSFSYNAGLNG